MDSSAYLSTMLISLVHNFSIGVSERSSCSPDSTQMTNTSVTHYVSPVTHYVFPCHSLCISFQVLGGLNYWLDIVEQEMNETAVGKHNFHLREHAKVCREVDIYLKIFHVILEDMVDEVVYIIYIVIYFLRITKISRNL